MIDLAALATQYPLPPGDLHKAPDIPDAQEPALKAFIQSTILLGNAGGLTLARVVSAFGKLYAALSSEDNG